MNFAELVAGNHIFNFTIKLPLNIPSSIEEDKGYIRYSAHVILKRPKHNDLKISRNFNVIRTIDLNKNFPDKKLPVEVEKISKLGCFCCSKSSLILTVKIPGTAFVSGQTFKISTNVINLTRSELESVDISFVKRVFYFSSSLGSKSKEKTSVVKSESIRSPEIIGGKIFYIKNFQIPKVVPSTENSCRVIQVSYEIHVGSKVGIIGGGV